VAQQALIEGLPDPQYERLAIAYMTMKEWVIDAGYAWEVDWQDQLCFSDLTESRFLCEAAWVILSAGFSNAVLRTRFMPIAEAFCCFRNAEEIVDQALHCRRNALSVFGNSKKIDAIIEVARRVLDAGFQETKLRIETERCQYLESFPQIGPVTAVHLMKNVGIDIVKPDRHLIRAAAITGHSPETLCQVIAQIVGDRISVVDLVIWRFATLRSDYCGLFGLPSDSPVEVPY